MKKKLRLSKEDLSKMKLTSQGSKLLPFLDDIMYLRINDVSFGSIAKWLGEHGVSSTTENIRQFYIRHKADYDYRNVRFELNDTNPDDNVEELDFTDSDDIEEGDFDELEIYDLDMRYSEL